MSQPLSTTESQGSCPPPQDSVGGVVRGPLVLPLSTWDSLKIHHQGNRVRDFLKEQLSPPSEVTGCWSPGRGLLSLISHLARLSVVPVSHGLLGDANLRVGEWMNG